MEQNESGKVTPEQIIDVLVNLLGPQIECVSIDGMNQIRQVIAESSDKELASKIEALKIRTIPLFFGPPEEKKEESRIILPSGMPKGSSRIIT